jgi:PAS domain S-box-containing protein
MISVLYVDDEATLLELTKLFLEYRGEFSVDTKQSVQEGLATLKTRKYDAVVSDFQMPGIDGLEFLRNVRTTFGDLPFILFTGKGREDVAIQAIDDGVDFYLRKGDDARLQFARLENRIKVAIERRTPRTVPVSFGIQVADLINFFPDATFAIDKDGTLIGWNHAMEALTGVPTTEVLGKGNYEYSRVLYGEPRPSLVDLIFRSDAAIEKYYPRLEESEGGLLVSETRLEIPRRSSLLLSCRAMPLRDQKGSVIGAIESLALPVTELPAPQNAGVLQETPTKTGDHRQKIEEILASLPGVVYQYCSRPSGENDVYFVNRSASETILGFDCSDGDFFSWVARHMHPDDRERFTAAIDGAQADAAALNFEGRFIKPSGETIWIWGMGNRSVREGEQSYAGIFLDISARKKAELKIQEYEEKFRLLAGHSREPVLVVDFTGSILFANSAVARILGVGDSGSLIGKTVMDFIAPESRDELAQEFVQASRGSGTCPARYTFISVQGNSIPVESTGTVVVYEGKIAEFLSLRDMTEGRALEEALKEGDEQFRLLFDHMDEPVALCEIVHSDSGNALDYRILAANDAVERTLGASRSSVIWKTSREAYDLSEPPHLDIYSRVATTGKRETFEQYFPELQKHFRISVSSPGKDRFATIFYDITKHKKAETALLQANHQLNLMASITRHDILNNVSALLGYVTILRMKFQNPALSYYFTKLEDITTAIQHLISDTQMYQNFGIAEPKWLEAGTLIRHLQIPETIVLTVDLADVELYADPLLEKVFFNLLDNSIRHGQTVTEIHVSSRHKDDRLILSWEDNGVGIPPEEKNRIFEKGFGKNTGLGLFLCREILSITNISIQETGEPGRGARFEITVPPGGYRLTDTPNYSVDASRSKSPGIGQQQVNPD